MYVPSVFKISASSMFYSWLFVPEKSRSSATYGEEGATLLASGAMASGWASKVVVAPFKSSIFAVPELVDVEVYLLTNEVKSFRFLNTSLSPQWLSPPHGTLLELLAVLSIGLGVDCFFRHLPLTSSEPSGHPDSRVKKEARETTSQYPALSIIKRITAVGQAFMEKKKLYILKHFFSILIHRILKILFLKINF